MFIFFHAQKCQVSGRKDIPSAQKVQTAVTKMVHISTFYFLVKLIYLKQINKLLEIFFLSHYANPWLEVSALDKLKAIWLKGTFSNQLPE